MLPICWASNLFSSATAFLFAVSGADLKEPEQDFKLELGEGLGKDLGGPRLGGGDNKLKLDMNLK